MLDDDVTDDGSVFIVMELLDGESLDARVERKGGRLPVDEVLAIANQLLDVLAAAHDKSIVHRDVKPENIFLTREGEVKVLDFGIARLRELSSTTGATRTGASMGTPPYMSPEQARGLWNEVDARSDVWSVGATLFFLLAGRPVHTGRTGNETLIAAATSEAPPLPDAHPLIERWQSNSEASRCFMHHLADDNHESDRRHREGCEDRGANAVPRCIAGPPNYLGEIAAGCRVGQESDGRDGNRRCEHRHGEESHAKFEQGFASMRSLAEPGYCASPRKSALHP